MSTDLETSLIRDLMGSGASGDPNAPLNGGLTPQELANGIPHTLHEVKEKLEMMASFSTVPVEECGNGKYRLTSVSDARNYLSSSSCNATTWPALSDE